VTPSATVMTVRGPIPAEQMGTTLPHEHVFLDLWKEFGREGVLNDLELAVSELNDYVDAGGATLVDCTSIEIGRDPTGLRRASERTGLNIVMGTSHYRHPYLDRDWFDRHDTGWIAQGLIDDITQGVDGIRAGIIGEVATELEWITTTEERSFRAAARAHRATGITISTHAACWPVGLPQLDLLENENVDPRRVIIGHCDTVPDQSYHLEIARRGAYVQFDTIRASNDYELDQRLRFVADLAAAGFLDQILFSHDICLRRHLQAYGGSGYSFVLRGFVPRLLAAGFSDAEIRRIIVDNPRRALTGDTSRAAPYVGRSKSASPAIPPQAR
jgi:predicted metal-dependent phosphotriesterase family hydrolase